MRDSLSRGIRAAAIKAVVLLTIVSSAGAEAPLPPTAAELQQHILELRCTARYDSAAALAARVYGIQQAATAARPHEILATEHLLTTLRRAAGLSEVIRDSLAGADRLQVAYDSLHLFPELGRDSTACRQVAIRRRFLPGDTPWTALSLLRCGAHHMRSGHLEESGRCLQEASDMYARLYPGGHPEAAMTLYAIGQLCIKQDTMKAAEGPLRAAVDMLQKIGFEGEQLYAELTARLGWYLTQHGDLAEGCVLAQEALTLTRTLNEPCTTQVSYMTSLLALIHYLRGDYTSAEALMSEAQAISRELYPEGHFNIAACSSGLGLINWARGDFDQAETHLRQAVAMARQCLGPDTVTPAFASNLAVCLVEQNKLDEAEALFLEVLDHLRPEASDPSRSYLDTLFFFSYLLRAQGRYPEDEVLQEKVLAGRVERLEPTHPSLCRSMIQLAAARQRSGRLAEAESLLTAAINVYESCRRRAGEGFSRARFHAASPYTRLSMVRLDSGKSIAAWEAAEMDRGRLLEDLRVRSEACFRAAAERRRPAGDSDAPADTNDPVSMEGVQACLDQHTAIMGWIESRPSATERTAWGYVLRATGPPFWVRLEPPSGAGSEERPTERFCEALTAPPGIFSGRPSRAAGQVKSTWIEPLAPALADIDRLIVIPSGSMLGIPIEALPGDTSDQWLGDQFTVSYAPSATSLTWWRSAWEPREQPHAALLVGDPPMTQAHLEAMLSDRPPLSNGPGDSELGDLARLDPHIMRSSLRRDRTALVQLPRLLGSRMEVQSLAAICHPATILLGPDATESRLDAMARNRSLASYRWVHFATHALVDHECPELSALVLSQVGESGDDGLLQLGEIIETWKLNADLVTLSACETALGSKIVGGALLGGTRFDRQAGSDGFIGFPHAFLAAGARSVLVSLWKVDDRATFLLMNRFYQNRTGAYRERRGRWHGSPMPKAAALREAKHWLRNYADEEDRRPFADPYYWAAFILIGEGDG